MPIKFSRHTDSQLRLLLSVLGTEDNVDLDEVAARLEQLRRGLEPEDEFSLILAWLGRCRLVHKLGQEQLPIASAETYRVPDLLAVFEVGKKLIPVLIEVKKREKLTIHPGYVRYAELVGLPLLVAWQHLTFWTLFDVHDAVTSDGAYKINFSRAMEQNLLMVLAGDFSYHVAPGTAIRMRIKKLSPPDDNGGFRGEIEDIYFTNPAGERIPNIPHLSSLFLIWDNEVDEVDEGDAIVQSFVIPDVGYGEFASRTLGKLLRSFAALDKRDVDLRRVMHDTLHWVHNAGEFRQVVNQGAEYGVFTRVLRLRPRNLPAFLKDVELK